MCMYVPNHLFFRLDSDLAKRNSFAHFSAFRPVAKIGDILQLSSTSASAAAASTQDSGEICEVSTTVDKDEESVDSSPSKFAKKIFKKSYYFTKKLNFIYRSKS